MKYIFLQKHQNHGSNISHLDNDRRRIRRLKINIVLISTVLGICASIRASEKKIAHDPSENTKQLYFDAPYTNKVPKFDHGQLA